MRRAGSALCRRSTGWTVRRSTLAASSQAKLGDPVIVASGAGVKPVRAMIVGKQEFAGYWEYLLDEGDFDLPRPSVLGRRRRDRPARQACRHRVAPCRAIDRARRPARYQHGRADIFSCRRFSTISWPMAGSTNLWPVARRLLRRKRRRDYRGERLRQWPGRGTRACAAATFSPASPGLKSRASPISIANIWSRGPAGVEIPIEIVRDGRAIRPAHPFRGSRELPQAPTLAVRAEPRFSRPAGARRRSR